MAVAPALASGAPESATANTVYIKAGKGGLRFVAPKTIVAGEDLTVLNQTNPHQVGPHTFSLVTKGSIPKTPNARKNCFTPETHLHGDRQVARVKGNGPVKMNPVEVGARRLGHARQRDQEGRLLVHRQKPGTSFVQPVSAAAGTTIYFMCAIHPWMHGSIEVRAPADELAARLEAPQIHRAWGAELSSAPWAAARSPRPCRWACARGRCCRPASAPAARRTRRAVPRAACRSRRC